MTGAALHGLTGVVTGASGGVGRAIALALTSAGASVCAIGRRRAELELTASRAVGAGAGDVTLHEADLVVDSDMAALVRALRERPGGIDILVHAAGAFSMGAFEMAPVAEFDRQYATNVRAPYVLTQALVGVLRAARGQVVFINSTVITAARAQVGPYAATKHALKGIADALREELNADGVRIVSVYPGRTATAMQARIHAIEGRPYAPERLLQPEDVASVVLDVLTLPRSAEVTDVYVRPMLKS